MAYSLKSGVSVAIASLNESLIKSKTKGAYGLYPSSDSLQLSEPKSKQSSVLRIGFLGKPVVVPDQKGLRDWSTKVPNFNFSAQASILVGKAHRWWEKSLKPNMVEIRSAQELVDSLRVAGDKLAVVDFYSPACGGCKALHPKICQLAELHPNAVFLKVNQEELKTMCHCLNIHVLPFFRFYRGAEGRVCSFSCTNATVKKFKDALAKHGFDRCSLGPAKGLDESELTKLELCGELSINLPPLASIKEERVNDVVMNHIDLCGVFSKAGDKLELREQSAIL